MDTFYKQIGNRVKTIRNQLDINQKDIATKLSISRSSLSQIENGERKITAEELLKLSEIFNISMNVLFGIEKPPEVTIDEKTDRNVRKTATEIRINVPQKNLKKFKEVLLYILNMVGSKPNIGETVLYKLLYFTDFNFYEKYEEQLIGASYLKNNYGPTPIEFKKIADEMIANQEIEPVKSKYFNYPQTKYLPVRKPDLSILKANEIELIDKVLNKLSDMNAKQISDYSHSDVPWLTTNDGEIIEYESVFYRTPEYSVREYPDEV